MENYTTRRKKSDFLFKTATTMVLALTAVGLSTPLTSVFADDAKVATVVNVNQSEGDSDTTFGELDQRTVTLETGEVVPVYTQDEIVAKYAADYDVSLDDAKTALGIPQQTGYFKAASANTVMYTTLSKQFTVTSSYKPSIEIYGQIEGVTGSSFWSFKSIKTAMLNRSYNKVTKQFAGKIYVNLESKSRIYWWVNGDFFNNGTTTVTAGGSVSVGVGASATVNSSVSSSSNHYAYVDTSGYFTR